MAEKRNNGMSEHFLHAGSNEELTERFRDIKTDPDQEEDNQKTETTDEEDESEPEPPGKP